MQSELLKKESILTKLKEKKENLESKIGEAEVEDEDEDNEND